MRKWLRRTLLGLAASLLIAVSAGVLYEWWSWRRVAREYPPPGELIEFGGKRSHLHCTGEGAPTVILEAGLDVGGSTTWAKVQPLIAERTRVCSYDRAGILWSEPRKGPRNAHRIAEELHALLQAASVPPPYILVGHSLGGLLVRVYADRFPEEVAGVVLVDASHPDQFERYPAQVLEALESLEPSLPSPIVLRVLASTGIYRGLILPPPRNAVTAFLPRTVPWGYAGERAVRAAISRQAAAARGLGDRPLVVLTAGVGPRFPGVPDEVTKHFYETWLTLQTELAALSRNSVHRIVEGATHNIQQDDPEAVNAAVQDILRAMRSGDLRRPIADS